MGKTINCHIQVSMGHMDVHIRMGWMLVLAVCVPS